MDGGANKAPPQIRCCQGRNRLRVGGVLRAKLNAQTQQYTHKYTHTQGKYRIYFKIKARCGQTFWEFCHRNVRTGNHYIRRHFVSSLRILLLIKKRLLTIHNLRPILLIILRPTNIIRLHTRILLLIKKTTHQS